MFADMTNEQGYGSAVPSGWKVAYFRVLGWEQGEPNAVIDPNKPPVLEICLVPEDSDVEEFKNHWKGTKEVAFKVPRHAQIIRVRAGDNWPKLQEELLVAFRDIKCRGCGSEDGHLSTCEIGHTLMLE